MKRVLVPLILVAAFLIPVPATAAPKPGPDRFEAYAGELTAAEVAKVKSFGVGHEDLSLAKAKNGKIKTEAILSPLQAAKIKSAGIRLTRKSVDGKFSTQQAQNVFRPYGGAGGIREEIVKAASDHPDIAQAVDFGKTLNGTPMTAIRVTKGARTLKNGKRPAVVYQGAQHAREWITPEMIRRLLHHYLTGYGSNAELTSIVNTTDLWFIPVINADGYDHTFTPGNRLWRKNLRDNDGDGTLTTSDGVDPNRNFPYKWGYDNEGSSPNIASQTYRGTAPASEPETKAQIAFYSRVKPKNVINWHSAAELLLYGVGWQQATPTPDDLVHEAMLGDDANSAVPGYDPDIGAELYTTNGETDGYLENKVHALAHTPEMSTCEVASNVDPDDEWKPEDCLSGFHFPDDEKLIQQEYAKNVPYAVATAKSAHNPDHPVSVVGRTVPDFAVDKFGVSYGSSQPVAVTARRSLIAKLMRYRINGGKARVALVREWKGGERYGDENDTYFAEYRGTVRGAKPGDKVEVWFQGFKRGKGLVQSEHFTYSVRDKAGAQVLVVSNEDYKGRNPTYPPSVTKPKYSATYEKALDDSGVKSRVWDVTAEGVPHHLGVLGHFKGVVWYMGDNRITQDAEDEITETFFGNFTDASAAEREQYLTIAIRDYLNEGGKLLHTAETAGYFGRFASDLGGIWYALDGAPDKECQVTADPFADCLLLADDFRQYYLGAYTRSARANPTGLLGTGTPLTGVDAKLGGAADNPENEAGNFGVTSDTLPPADFPQFTSSAAAQFGGKGGAFDPVQGDWYVAGPHADSSYMRLTRTVDLSNVSAAKAPKLEFQISYDTENSYDNVILEARTPGGDDWTTLPDLNGKTDTDVPVECEAGFLLDLHPHLKHYLTPGNPCGNTGTSGKWNRFTGNSGGWHKAATDLSAYAGKKVEVSISYVTDPGSGGVGAFVDDTKVTTTDGTLDSEGFESALGPWSVPGAPPGSPKNATDFTRGRSFGAAAVTTKDTVLLGVGLEQTAPEDRAKVMKAVMKYLLS